MKILGLEVQNVMKIKAVEIHPKTAAVVVGGKNGNGKTSVLSAIAMAIGGKDMFTDVPVRRGSKSARIRCDLGDLVITRTFTEAGGSTLKVTTADGKPVASPQTILDRMLGSLTFDPLAFERMKPKDQADTLRRLVGLDFSTLDAERKRLYDDRTIANRSAEQAKARATAAPFHSDAPAEETSIKDLAAKLRVAREYNEHVNAAERTIDQHVKTIERLMAELERARASLDIAKQRLSDHVKTAPGPVDAFGLMDVVGLESMMSDAESSNRKARENAERQRLIAEAEKAAEESKAITSKIEAIDATKAKVLADAKFPIAGLSIDESGVTFNNLPFSMSSSAERLRVSVSIGLAMNRELKVMLVRDGSLLDEDSLAVVAEIAAAHDAQLWIERVGNGAECSVILEDGMIAGSIESQSPADPIDDLFAEEKPF